MTAMVVLAMCGPSAAAGTWMLRNAARTAATQAATDRAFWTIARHYQTTTAEEPQP
ncbi:hypothetical protein ABT093_09850 [Kitasatospora sp. NPDC002551]|uniref:hypothetical protein n=1 Tax=Kitasatospora sp. NPDC002551 TaxID=3154539 RepID=UPI00332FCF78